jgi:TonB family protein
MFVLPAARCTMTPMSGMRYVLIAAMMACTLWAQTAVPPVATSEGNQPSVPDADLTLDRIQEVKAIYPTDADQGKPPGDVLVRIHISGTGEVESAELVSGNPGLAGAAVDAAKQWRFKPYLRGGKPVELSTVLPVQFAPSEMGSARGIGTMKIGRFSRESDAKSGEPENDSSAALGDPAKRIHVSQQIMQRMIVDWGTFSYPKAAKDAKIRGTVVLKAIISKGGAVEQLQSVSGPDQLLDGSMEIVRRYKYRSFILDDQPVEVETTVTLIFR